MQGIGLSGMGRKVTEVMVMINAKSLMIESKMLIGERQLLSFQVGLDNLSNYLSASIRVFSFFQKRIARSSRTARRCDRVPSRKAFS